METVNAIIVEHAPRLGAGLAIVLVFWVFALLAKKAVRRLLPSVTAANHHVALFGSTAYYAVILIGVLTGLNTMGVRMGPIIASLGLGGFAVGFALRDVIGNFLAGALILVYRPFNIDDYLVVSGCAGRVVEINMRYTVLAGPEAIYLIPNGSIFTTPLQLKATPQ